MRLVRCPRCNTFNSPNVHECATCGFDLNYCFCSKCGTKIKIGTEKCPNCGSDNEKLLFAPFPVKKIVDPKYLIKSIEVHGTILKEVNPNLIKIQTDSAILEFYNSSGNLYDSIEVGKNSFLPLIEKPTELRKISQIWQELGDEARITFIKSLIERISGFNLYFPERLEDIVFDERYRPCFPVLEHKEKGYIDSKDFLCNILRVLKGYEGSLWENEKNEIIRKKCEAYIFINWLDEIKQKIHMNSVSYAGISDKGPTRTKNEDAILMIESSYKTYAAENLDAKKQYLFVLSDGLGGHERGEVAAELIVDGISKEFYKHLLPKSNIELEDIVESIGVVNNYVYSKNTQTEMTMQRMGGTISGLLIDRDRFMVFNVGDSPIFLLNDEDITELSIRDTSTKKNKAITQAIGIRPFDEIEVHINELQIPWEKFKVLICSDGLTDVVTPVKIASIIKSCKKNLREACLKLLEEAYEKKSSDNVSVIVVNVEKEIVIGR